MFLNQSSDDIIAKQEKQILELEIRLAMLQKNVSKLYEDIGVSPEQLNAVLQKSEYFSKDEWEKIQEQKKEIETRLEKERLGIASAQKATKTREQLSELKRHWLFVR